MDTQNKYIDIKGLNSYHNKLKTNILDPIKLDLYGDNSGSTGLLSDFNSLLDNVSYKTGRVDNEFQVKNTFLKPTVFKEEISLETNGVTGSITSEQFSGSAKKWTNPISLSLTGDCTGSVMIDGSEGVSIATDINTFTLDDVKVMIAAEDSRLS